MLSRSALMRTALALAATLGVPAAPAVGATVFTIETVDSASFATAATLVATPSGGLVLSTGALGGTPAYYVSGGGTPYSGRVFEHAGGAWQPSPAPPPVDISLPHALAVDGDGWRHFVSWQYPVSDSSRPLLQDEGPDGWTATVLDTNIVNSLGITVDGQGRLWVAWLRGHRFNCCSAPPYELLVAHRTTQGWSRDSLEVPFLPYHTPYPLAVDAAGRAHVLFVGDGGQGLHHAVRTAGGWETTLVDGGTISPDLPRLLPGPDGTVHALYRVGAELRHAHWSVGGWQVESLPFGLYDFSPYDLAIDKAGHPRIAFVGVFDGSGPNLVYATRSATGWAPVLVSYWIDTFLGGLSLALDEFDRAAVAFQGPGHREVSVATQAGTADVGPDAGRDAVRLRLALVSGNPARVDGALRWRVDLPSTASVTLEAYDLAGRRISAGPSWTAPRGVSELEWTPASLPAGVCFVRATAGGAQSPAVPVFMRR